MIVEQQTPLAKFIEEYANRSPYTYEEIALLSGYRSADIIYALMRGEVRLTLDKVAPIAGAIGCDAGQLFALTLETWFSPPIFDQIRECFISLDAEGAERAWMVAIREIFGGKVPELTVEQRKRLELLLKPTATAVVASVPVKKK